MSHAPLGRLRRVAAAAAVASCALFALAGPAQAAFGDRTLQRGSRGHDVRVLQSWLSHLGVKTQVDGMFGRGTELRLRRFERSRRWRVDGKLSPRDARAMRRLMKSRAGESQPPDAPVAGERAYFGATRGATLQVEVTQPGPITVEVVQADTGQVADVITQEVPGAGTHTVAWDGALPAGGPAPETIYFMRLAGESRARASAVESARFSFHHHKFPVRGRHDYGQEGARFGSGRSGHSHQGQDVFAPCGTNLVAAQGGKVVYSGYHSAAGHYIVIRGAGSGEDYVYMHLEQASPFRTGDTVSTGRSIGRVGDSGNASGCHLHFELWGAPGWYEGGSAYDPYDRLQAWDRCC